MTAQACTQPGCTGTIQDGYCDVCGTPADAPVAMPAGGDGAGGAASSTAVSTPSRATSASNRLASMQMGTALAGSGSRPTRPAGTGSFRLRGGRLGAGLTTVPPIPEVDAVAALLKNPQLPEDRRYCPSCGNAVGRSRDGRPGRTEGFCPQCRNPFSFSP